MAKLSLKTVLYGSIGLLLLFVLASSLILPYFRNTYEYGFGTTPCSRDDCDTGDTALSNPNCLTHSTTAIACTSCNATAGYEYFLDNCGDLISAVNGTHCYQCTTFQGYRTSMIGLMLLVLVLALVGFAVIFLPKLR